MSRDHPDLLSQFTLPGVMGFLKIELGLPADEKVSGDAEAVLGTQREAGADGFPLSGGDIAEPGLADGHGFRGGGLAHPAMGDRVPDDTTAQFPCSGGFDCMRGGFPGKCARA